MPWVISRITAACTRLGLAPPQELGLQVPVGILLPGVDQVGDEEGFLFVGHGAAPFRRSALVPTTVVLTAERNQGTQNVVRWATNTEGGPTLRIVSPSTGCTCGNKTRPHRALRARLPAVVNHGLEVCQELRGKWVLKGKPALVDSTSPRYGEKASYYSAVCLETGEMEWMELEGNSNSGTSVDFLKQLREKHSRPLQVIWDNAPAHRGDAVREYLRTPALDLRLVKPLLCH